MGAKRILAALVLLTLAAALTGCVSSGSRGWPVQTYNHTCHTGTTPDKPVCLSIDGFKYQDEFQACQQDMSNFVNALDSYYGCSENKLRATFDDLLRSVPDKFNCYAEFFKDKKEGDPSITCPPLDVPFFPHSYEADGLEHGLGVPLCIRKSQGYNFSPKRAYVLEDCRKQVEVFMGKRMLTNSFDAAPAQDQYATYLRNLRRVLDRKADDAVRKFNCLAESRGVCF